MLFISFFLLFVNAVFLSFTLCEMIACRKCIIGVTKSKGKSLKYDYKIQQVCKHNPYESNVYSTIAYKRHSIS